MWPPLTCQPYKTIPTIRAHLQLMFKALIGWSGLYLSRNPSSDSLLYNDTHVICLGRSPHGEKKIGHQNGHFYQLQTHSHQELCSFSFCLHTMPTLEPFFQASSAAMWLAVLQQLNRQLWVFCAVNAAASFLISSNVTGKKSNWNPVLKEYFSPETERLYWAFSSSCASGAEI